MSSFLISNNALHIGQIGELRTLLSCLTNLDFNKLTYQELRDKIKSNCDLLRCTYVLIDQSTQGYTNLMDCEDSDLLTDIAHGLNKFVNGNFKFSVKRKTELKQIFSDYYQKLNNLCDVTLNELNNKSNKIRFSLPVIHGSTVNRVAMVNESNDMIHAVDMSYFYADLKRAIAARQLLQSKQDLDFETVFTEKNYWLLSDRDGCTEFTLNDGKVLRVKVGKGHSQSKYLVLFGLFGKIGSHLLTKRQEIKKNGFMCDNITKIAEQLREFADLKLTETHNHDQSVCFVGIDKGRKDGLYGDSFDQRAIYMIRNGADPIFVCNHHTNTKKNRYNKSNTEEMQRYTNQLVKTNGSFFCLHSNLSFDPFEYLKQMREYNATFEPFLFSAELCKKSGYYQIAGNLKEISAVFRFRFYDETLFRLWLQMAAQIDPAMDCKYNYSKPITMSEKARLKTVLIAA